jgi:prepilin-type N-terminal cleavage/methylation domain-containing protein
MVNAMQKVCRGISTRCGFTLVELMVVVIVLSLWGLILLIHLSGQRVFAKTSVSYPDGTRVRGIHTAMTIYAQGNNTYFPGLDSNGIIVDPSPEHRIEMLLREGYVSPSFVISPHEIAIPWDGGRVTSDNYSYAMLRIDDADQDAGRLAEWRATFNGYAAVLSDRSTGFPPDYESIATHRNPSRTGWLGAIGWNDNSVTAARSPVMESTTYNRRANRKDHLFEASGPNDAMMIFSSYSSLPTPRRMPMRTDSFPSVWLVWIVIGLGLLVLWIAISGVRRHKPSSAGTISNHETSQR